MADDNIGNTGNNPPEMTPEEKKLHDMLQKELIHYSMTFKDSIDSMAVRQREETQKLIEQNMTGVVDAILAKNEQSAQNVVDKTIAALRAESEKQQQAAPRPQPAQAQTQMADPNNQESELQIPQNGQVKPLDYLLFSIGKFLQQTTPKDIVEMIHSFRPPVPVAPQAGDQIAGLLKFQRILGDLRDAGSNSNLTDERIEKVRQETNSAFKATAVQP